MALCRSPSRCSVCAAVNPRANVDRVCLSPFMWQITAQMRYIGEIVSFLEYLRIAQPYGFQERWVWKARKVCKIETHYGGVTLSSSPVLLHRSPSPAQTLEKQNTQGGVLSEVNVRQMMLDEGLQCSKVQVPEEGYPCGGMCKYA